MQIVKYQAWIALPALSFRPELGPEKAIATGCVIVNQILIVPPLACFASIAGAGVA
jgi:hypothetical protein